MPDNSPISFDRFLDDYKKDKGKQPKNDNTRGGGRSLLGRPSVAVGLSKLNAARRTPPAIFKVVSRGHSVTEAHRLLDYNSRNKDELQDTIAFVDETGLERFGDKDELRKMVEDWSVDFRDWGGGDRKATNFIHFMVSTPYGTNSDITLDAAREFYAEAFPGHRFALTLHTDTPYPHVHGVVCYQGEDGSFIRTNKERIQEYRDLWAASLIDRGIQVTSTPRSFRAVEEKSLPHKVFRLLRRQPDVADLSKRQSKPGWKKEQQRAWLSAAVDSEKMALKAESRTGQSPISKLYKAHGATLKSALKSVHGIDVNRQPDRDRTPPDIPRG